MYNIIFYFITCLVCGVIMLPSCKAQSSVYSLVYEDVNVNAYDKCVRLLNGTNQIGCQSSMDGDVGILFHMKDASEIADVKDGPHPPYIVILHADLLNKVNVRGLKATEKVTGIVVYSFDNYTGKAGGWSSELQCPRYRYGLYNATYGVQYAGCEKNKWNLFGNGLMEEDIPFPVFVLKNYTVAASLLECHDEHNLDQKYPYCAAQMKSRMFAAVSTEVCMRRNSLQNNLSPMLYCDPIGGHNFLASLRPSNSSEEDVSKPVILITATLDSRSFEVSDTSFGANAATGLITFLATAKALGSLSDEVKQNINKDILFLLFDGEAFDNTGSSRVAFDMLNGEFPMKDQEKKWQPVRFNLSSVEAIIEFGQLGLGGNQAWLHYDPVSYKDSTIKHGVDDIINKLKSSATSQISLRDQSPGIGLVPSSLHSFLRTKNVSGIVITDFDTAYKDKYYFSRYDTLDVLGITPDRNATEEENLVHFSTLSEKLSNLSSTTARAVYQLATGKTDENLTADKNLIAKLLYCYLFNANCSLFKEILQVNSTFNPPNAPFDRYVGVYGKDLEPQAVFARNFIAISLGELERLNATKDNCKADSQDDIFDYFAFNGDFWTIPEKVCYRAALYTLDGRSPSTTVSGYDYANGPYPAWAESRWSKTVFSFRIFLVQDNVSQGMTLLAGLLMFLSSLFMTYIVSRKSEILFNHQEIL